MIRDSLYIQVFADRFVIRSIASGRSQTVPRDMTYASPRMLIADFTMAWHQLRNGIKSVRQGILAPELLFHPKELFDGGLTQVEHKVFADLGTRVGASRVGLWVGDDLPAEDVRRAIRDYKY